MRSLLINHQSHRKLLLFLLDQLDQLGQAVEPLLAEAFLVDAKLGVEHVANHRALGAYHDAEPLLVNWVLHAQDLDCLVERELRGVAEGYCE